MVHGLRTKTRKGPSVHVDYIIHIHEIKPWPPSQSLRTIRAVLIQWEHGNKNSGSTNQVVPLVDDGKIEFNESFRLNVTLMRDMSVKTGNHTFLKNFIEFNLYEPRRDKTVKGQLGTAIVDLSEYGVIRESLCISAPINCKRTYWNNAQPLLFLRIEPVERSRSNRLMRGASMDGNSYESVSVISEDCAEEEAEVASVTTDDDDDDDDVSSHSSLVVASAAGESNGSSSPLNKENGTVAVDVSVGDAKSDEEHLNVSQVKLENVQENMDRSKRGISVRSLVDSIRSNGPVTGNQFFVSDTQSHAQGSISVERKDLLSDSRIQGLEHRIKALEAELRESAAIEVSLYSVAAEHGSSMNKVHAPARRLSRLYFHDIKQSSKSRKGSAAKSIVSGLVLVSKACGNDVPRLTFWLSNCTVLRVIMSKSFGDGKLPISVGPVIGDEKKKSSPLKWDSFSSKNTRNAIEESFSDWENPLTFVTALEKVESWIFCRIIESIWWQTFTPHMQSGNAKEIRTSVGCESSKSFGRMSSSIDQQQGNYSLEHWKGAFRDACERICPVRAEGHDCGCLPVLSRVIMEQLIARLDVAMFNAILRESVDEIPTDPVADPISDPEVLPIPAGKPSFGAGAQLKNAIGNWSRWLTDLFGIDDDALLEDISKTIDDDDDDERISHDTSSKCFRLLNALSDLMMLPKDMLLSRTVRKEVCPTFGPPIIRRVLNSFIPDEFCADPIPAVVLVALNSEDHFDSEDDSIMNFPCDAAPIVYQPPPATSVASIIGDIGSHSQLTCTRSSMLRKSQTSDDELDELDSPLKSIILDGFPASPSSSKPGWISREYGSRNALRYQLLRDVWMNCD